MLPIAEGNAATSTVDRRDTQIAPAAMMFPHIVAYRG
jgi:hypothetical protein